MGHIWAKVTEMFLFCQVWTLHLPQTLSTVTSLALLSTRCGHRPPLLCRPICSPIAHLCHSRCITSCLSCPLPSRSLLQESRTFLPISHSPFCPFHLDRSHAHSHKATTPSFDLLWISMPADNETDLKPGMMSLTTLNWKKKNKTDWIYESVSNKKTHLLLQTLNVWKKKKNGSFQTLRCIDSIYAHISISTPTGSLHYLFHTWTSSHPTSPFWRFDEGTLIVHRGPHCCCFTDKSMNAPPLLTQGTLDLSAGHPEIK